MQTNSRWLCVVLIAFAPLKTMRGCTGEQVNLTNSIDYLIPYVSEYMVDNKMDPLNISDVHQSFCLTDLFLFPPPICIGLKYSLSSGVLYHLSQIKRRGPVIVTMKGGLVTVDSNLSFDRISVSFKYLLELLFLRQHGRSVIEADTIWANIGFAVNVSSCKFAFKKFKLTNVESIKVTSKDDGLTSQLIVIVANVVLNLMKDRLIASVEGGGNTALREAFKGMNEAPCPWSPLSLFRTMREDDSSDGLNDDGVSGKINKFFDTMLPTIKKIILRYGLDPLKLDDMSEKLPGVINHSRVIDLTNGWFQGLSNLKRAKDVIMSFENKILSIDANLHFDLLDFNYEYDFRDLLISRKGDVHGNLKNMQMRVVVGVDFNQYKLVFERAEIIQIGTLDIKLEGHIIDPIVNAAIKAITKVFHKKVIAMVEKQVAVVLQSLLDKVNDKIPRPDTERILNADFTDYVAYDFFPLLSKIMM